MFVFFFSSSGTHHDLHSFPTRRSSDLSGPRRPGSSSTTPSARWACTGSPCASCRSTSPRSPATRGPRSEEHTSELQSRRDLVCRLLLEKKNQHAGDDCWIYAFRENGQF